MSNHIHAGEQRSPLYLMLLYSDDTQTPFAIDGITDSTGSGLMYICLFKKGVCFTSEMIACILLRSEFFLQFAINVSTMTYLFIRSTSTIY